MSAYVDASAVVKLFKTETETDALRDALSDEAVWVSSELIAVELRCTARRLGEHWLVGAERVLDGIDRVVLDETIRERAGGSAFSPPLRALDAIHLASALSMAEDLDGFFAYDDDLCTAAAAEGLVVRSPA